MNSNVFAKRLKELMDLEGLSKRGLSLKINVDRKSIRLWLEGRFYPRYDALIKLATFFKIRIDSLIGLENQQKDVTELTGTEEPFCSNTQGYFFEKLSAYMKEHHMTRYACAKKVGIDQKSFINWLTKGSMPETTTIIRVAALMKISIDELLGRKV